MPEISVIHLASASLGREPFEVFLDSYRRRSAGIAHELVVVLNGFRDLQAARSAGFLDPLANVPHQAICCHPLAIDLVVYADMARQLDTEFLCFLNATSELLGDDWLAKLRRHSARPEVGIVGATASYETHRDSQAVQWRAFRGLRTAVAVRTKRAFPAFPNPHIRTNAFMLRSHVFRELRPRRVETKFDAYRFESGTNGVTAQIRHLGLHACVVGRDGTGYDVDDWPASGTFRAGEQHNLLVADRRTREWDDADPVLRRQLATAAWGAPERGPTIAGSL